MMAKFKRKQLLSSYFQMPPPGDLPKQETPNFLGEKRVFLGVKLIHFFHQYMHPIFTHILL